MVGKKTKNLLNFVAWITGVIVSLAVGFAMVDGVLYIRWLPGIITVVAGWIVIVTTAISVVLAILKQ